MIFKTINDENTLSGQRIVSSLQARKIAQEEAARQLEVDIQCLKKYEIECQKGNVSTETFAKTMDGASVSAQKYATNIKDGTGSAQTFATNQRIIQSSMNETSVVSKVASAGLNLFKAALSSFVFFAVIEGIQLLVKGIDSLILTAEEAEEKAENLRNSMQSFFDEVQSGQQTISSISDRFSELSKHVTETGENIDLTKDEYSEYLDICNQVKSIMPELVTGYTNEGNAIITLKDNVDSLTESYKENIRAKAAAFVTNGDDDGNTIQSFFDDYKIFTKGEGGLFAPSAGGLWNNKSTDYEDYYGYDEVHKWLSEFADLSLKDLQNLQKGTTQATYLYALLKENGYELANITEDNYEAVHDVLDTRLTSLEGEMATRVSNVKMSLQQMLYADRDYWDIDNKEALSAIDSLFGSVDAEFIKQNNLLGQTALQSFESNVIKLFEDKNTQQAMIDIYTPQDQDESIHDYSKRVNDAIQEVQDYAADNKIDISFDFGEVTEKVNELEAQYQRAVDFAKDKFDGYDPTAFFKENSINTKEEVDKWLEIAQAANSAADAEERYVQGSTLDDQSGYTPFTLSESQSQALDDYQSKIKSIQSAYQELDTISPDSLIDLQQTFSDYDWNPYLNGTKSLETVLRELADTAEATALDSVPLLKEQISAIKDTAFETTESISNMADALSDLSSKEELRTSLKDILNTVDEIDVDTLQKIAKAYPQLEKEIGGYMAGVVSIKELYESLDDVYQQDLEAYALYVAQKNGNDETYYTSLITSLSDELKDKAKFYDIDLDNYKTYIEAKMAMEAKLLEAKQKSSLAKQKLENLYTQDGEDRNDVRNIEYENSVYGKIVKKSEKTTSEIQEIIDEFYKGVTLQFNLEEIPGFGSSSSSSSTKDYEESIDWAEQSIEVLERAVSDLNTTLDNTSGYEEQIKVIDTLIKAQEALKNGYESSAKQYKEKYNSELDQLPSSVRSAYQSKIESGEEFSIEDFVQKNVTSGDEGSKEKLKNQLDTIMDYYDKWQEANQNLAQTEQDLIESERQKLEVQLEQIEAKRENLNLEKELAVTAADKNAILKEDLKLAEEEAILRATLAETIEESTKVQLEHQQEKLDNQEEQNKNLQDEVNIVLDIISAQQESAGTLVEKNKLIDEEIAKRYELLQLELALAETEEERLLLQSQYNNFLQESAQEKQNNTIDAYDNQASILENQIQQIQNRIDLAETLNEQGTEQQYRDMIALSEKTASIYSQKKAYLEGLLSSTQYGSDRFYELQSAITECDEAIITAKQNQIEWNVAILQIPIKQIEKTIESLEKLKEEQEEQLGQYDQVVSAVVKVIEDQNKALEQQKELEEEIWDTKIKPLQDELDYLQKINEARKTQLSIEEALYNLNKAKNEKTLRIRKNGQVEYVADEEAIREAQQSYDDAVYNKKIQDLENQIDDLETQKEEALAKYDEEMEALDEYKEKWTEVANIFEDMSNHTIAATKLGVDFATNVIGRNLDMLNQFSQQYVELEGHIDSTQQQIEANETLLVSIQDIVDAYLAEQYTALEAETAIHDAIVSNGDELNAIGQLSDAYSDLTNGMLLADEKVKSTIGNNEVIMNALAELIAKYKETKEEIVKSVDEICLAYEKQLEASTNLKVSEDTLWQDRINNLNQVMEEFELIMDRSVTLVINDSRKMVSEVASAVQSAATSMSKLSSQLSSAKSMAQEISDLANLNSAPTSSETKVSGGGIKDIHTVKDIYHDGMENGFVGENLSGSSAQDSFRLLALKKLKPDELPSILQLKEAVLNEEQQKNVLMNMRQALVMNSRMDIPNNVSSRNVTSPNLTIGIENINLPNVNDAEQFVKALQTRLKSVSQQALYQNTNRRV